ncbi:MAG: aldo/keto reductase [bacterium]|nr:aldo/keto reductase [bacterium]
MNRLKLVLGTVQLGMRYGLNNSTGQPDDKESFAILDAALSHGIEVFDTAWAYGTAEDVLGKWIKSRDVGKKIRVISKMKPHILDEYPTGTNVTDIVRSEIEKSLGRLGIGHLDGYLLHMPEYIYKDDVVVGLQKAKEAGLVKNIGVSIYDEPEALSALELGMDYIQVPYNILDQRLDTTDFFQEAKERGTKVFARSPFLQGLLLRDPERLPPHLSGARQILEHFIAIIRRYNISQLEASLLFSHLHCPADHIVFGVKTRSQLDEIIAIIDRAPSIKNAPWITEIVDAFKHTDRSIVNPRLWKKA